MSSIVDFSHFENKKRPVLFKRLISMGVDNLSLVRTLILYILSVIGKDVFFFLKSQFASSRVQTSLLWLSLRRQREKGANVTSSRKFIPSRNPSERWAYEGRLRSASTVTKCHCCDVMSKL